MLLGVAGILPDERPGSEVLTREGFTVGTVESELGKERRRQKVKSGRGTNK